MSSKNKKTDLSMWLSDIKIQKIINQNIVQDNIGEGMLYTRPSKYRKVTPRLPTPTKMKIENRPVYKDSGTRKRKP